MLPLLMQVKTQRTSPITIQLDVEIPVDTVKSYVDRAYSDFIRKVKLPGFRPGRVPRHVIAQLPAFQQEIAKEVIKKLVDETFPKAIAEQKLMPVSTPSIKPQATDEIHPSQPFMYTASFEVAPEVKGVKYEGLELIRPSIAVTDAMVDEALEELRQRYVSLQVPQPPRAAQEQDVLMVEMDVWVNGRKINRKGSHSLSIELGVGQVLPAVEQALLGKKAGKEVVVDTVAPEDQAAPAVRGQRVRYKFLISEVKEKVLPALDEEFAKDVGEFANIEELRVHLKQKLEKEMKQRADEALAEQIIERLSELNPMEVPSSLVQRQQKFVEEEMCADALRTSFKRNVEAKPLLTHEELRREAEKKVRAGFIMGAIAQEHGLKIAREDIEKAYQAIAEESGKNVAKVKAEYAGQERQQILMGMILEDKVLTLIESKSVIKEASDEQRA
ncbi:trigger factor [Pajaroellobacter abortibovis]|uniref:Trigger factor n=1 Tax=Pajaroellobacter abortibovis TaxID=1882918 RepID=A0A1L6MVS4_9BACT|nr:trigger factor [Pajaroellobacter abortibovis]APR99643.1 trigger factor [Pajaroellobacter abortibovis]